MWIYYFKDQREIYLRQEPEQVWMLLWLQCCLEQRHEDVIKQLLEALHLTFGFVDIAVKETETANRGGLNSTVGAQQTEFGVVPSAS